MPVYCDYGGHRWITDKNGEWGTYVWEVRDQLQWSYGPPNPYLLQPDGVEGEVCRWVSYTKRIRIKVWVFLRDWLARHGDP